MVLDGLDLEIPEGKITVVLGPSGGGKTTFLNILSGMVDADEGSIGELAGKRYSYVFQEDRLLPWASALENVSLVLHEIEDRQAREARAEETLKMLGLGEARNQKPGTMSGGMCRRVALARAFAYTSEILLLDEPFSSLDLKTRIHVMDLFLKLREKDGRTAVIVTHDVREAIYLGDRIFTLSQKPARIRSSVDVSLGKSERSYTKAGAAELEAFLYCSILEDGEKDCKA